MTIRAAASPLLILAACSGAGAPMRNTGPVQIQLAFFHFRDDHVRVTVDGRTVFDQTITVIPENEIYGIAHSALITLPRCSKIVVTSSRQRVTKQFCLTAQNKSILIDGGPPLTITAKDHFQGDD